VFLARFVLPPLRLCAFARGFWFKSPAKALRRKGRLGRAGAKKGDLSMNDLSDWLANGYDRPFRFRCREGCLSASLNEFTDHHTQHGLASERFVYRLRRIKMRGSGEKFTAKD
jgi:hypothetical protein